MLEMKAQRILTIVCLSWSLLCASGLGAEGPDKASFIASARVVHRGFQKIDDYKGGMNAGFVSYTEITSQPQALGSSLREMLKEHYKPGTHADGPLTPVTCCAVLFDATRKAVWIVGIYGDTRITMSRAFEVDANCYQTVKDASLACTIDNSTLAGAFLQFVSKNQVLPVDIEGWRSGK